MAEDGWKTRSGEATGRGRNAKPGGRDLAQIEQAAARPRRDRATVAAQRLEEEERRKEELSRQASRESLLRRATSSAAFRSYGWIVLLAVVALAITVGLVSRFVSFADPGMTLQQVQVASSTLQGRASVALGPVRTATVTKAAGGDDDVVFTTTHPRSGTACVASYTVDPTNSTSTYLAVVSVILKRC